ncbi:pachytene checkpoint protein 2 homolog [Macrosteles quadrilineatus]|uniref:pachytene checkpoint protein 2 homolog n=1 Tax=Macrosteles quadrilineatus TaxID=74068 RepID=UPI0023E1971B|nr:pachytene checkpoint protein 2 homolog [Macrosteles quadrilineatus]
MMKMNPVLHVEILRRETSRPTVSVKELKESVQEEIYRLGKIKPGTCITQFSDRILVENVEQIQICDKDGESSLHHEKLADLQNEFLPRDVCLNFHVYRLNTEGVQLESMDSGDQSEEDQPVANHWILPSSDFRGLWESLVYDNNVKENLLSYMETTMLFSDCKVDTNIITWNRLVLLHGPPGTGKTSLCKALAHKLSIRMGHRYTHGQLVEINSHSLFSKFFSESGKLVGKMFTKIRELIEDTNALVFVLIDEVESLTRARESSMSGAEPSDMIRAVNSVLTEIDQIRKFPNVMILSTSNITGAIDGAFLDRADIKQYIGLPSYHAIFKIYLTCLKELIRVNLIVSSSQFDSLTFDRLRLESNGEDSTHESVQQLLALSRLSEGLSGRTLRRIPFLAHALFVKSRTANLDSFLRAMESAVMQQKNESEYKPK